MPDGATSDQQLTKPVFSRLSLKNNLSDKFFDAVKTKLLKVVIDRHNRAPLTRNTSESRIVQEHLQPTVLEQRKLC